MNYKKTQIMEIGTHTNESRSHKKIRRESYFTFSLNEKYAVLV